MHLIEILLPLNDNSGRPFDAAKYAAVRQQLTERFGGLTAFTRSPAQGTTTEAGKTVHDDIVVFEVMTEKLDVSWWRNYRHQLEREFRQDTVVARASAVTLL
jgi:cytochrome c556